MQIYGDLLGFYGVLKRLLALGVWKWKCKRLHKLAKLNHSVYQHETSETDIYYVYTPLLTEPYDCLIRYAETPLVLHQIGVFLRSTSDDPQEDTLKKENSSV